jgi:hypothetical protein
MFPAATKHSGHARVVVSPLYFYVGPKMCHADQHNARPTLPITPQAKDYRVTLSA